MRLNMKKTKAIVLISLARYIIFELDFLNFKLLEKRMKDIIEKEIDIKPIRQYLILKVDHFSLHLF